MDPVRYGVAMARTRPTSAVGVRRRPKDRKGQIARASAEAFSVLGYYGVSMETIAARVGISAAALYRHYSSKYELFRDAVLTLGQQLVDCTEFADDAAGDPELTVRRLVSALIDTAIRSDSDYGVTASVTNTPQTAGVLASNVTFWGVPGDPRHDQVRGWQCLAEDHGEIFGGHCRAENDETPTPFLQTATSCTGAPSTVPILADSWEAPSLVETFFPDRPLAPLDGCNRVPFGPQIASEPTANSATSPTGLNFDINVNDEGQKNAKGLVQSQIKKTVVTLPQGFTTNPSVAEGLKACSEAEYGKVSFAVVERERAAT